MQLDDDVFFAELSKRISLLITDDDEADFGSAQFPASLPVPGFSMAPHVPQGASMLAPPAYTLFHHAASYGAAAANNNNNSAAGDIGRAWQQQQQQQCGSKGTGVFIPRSTSGSAHSKRKGRNWSGGSKAAAHKARAAAAAQTEAAAVAAGTSAKRRA